MLVSTTDLCSQISTGGITMRGSASVGCHVAMVVWGSCGCLPNRWHALGRARSVDVRCIRREYRYFSFVCVLAAQVVAIHDMHAGHAVLLR